MDSLKMLLYTLARIGLMFLLVLFSAFVGEILFPAIVSIVPTSASSFKDFLTDPVVDSVFGMIIVIAFMVRIFYDDGKRHSAYESWSAVNITIVLLIMLFVYFVPAIFRDSFASEGKLTVFYSIMYYPSSWLTNLCEMNYLVSVVVGMGIILVTSFLSYMLAFRIYIRKHPVILTKMQEKQRFDEYDDEDFDDNN